MPAPIAEAFVKIRPDTSGFQTALQSQVAAAIAGVTVPPVGIAAGGVAAAGTAAAGAAAATSTLGRAAGSAGEKVDILNTRSNALRGVLIGLGRVTPVTVFGLGAVGSATIAAATAIRASISAAADFEQQMNVLQVVSGATAQQIAALSDQAKQLGADVSLPTVSAADAAASMLELSKAGLEVNDVMSATPGVLQLATAANIQNAEAAKIAASALNAFNLSGSEAAHVADLLAAASIAAQGEIPDMANALAQASAVANQAGISIEDTVTAISLLAKAGILGSDAGTSLRTTILRLVPTTKEAAQFVSALGISFADAEGNLRPLPDVFEQYRVALAKLPPVMRQAALQQIFGQDAIRAASILAQGGAAAFAQMRDEVEREGVAADVAGARTRGLAGSFSGLQSNLETLALNFGQLLSPALEETTNNLTSLVGNINDAIVGIQDLADAIAGIDLTRLPGDEQALDFLKFLIVPGEALSETVDVVATGIEKVGDILSGASVKNRAFNASIRETQERLREENSALALNADFIERIVRTLDRIPTVSEIRILIEGVREGDLQEAFNQVVLAAFSSGDLTAEEFARGFRSNIGPMRDAASRNAIITREAMIQRLREWGDAGTRIGNELGSDIAEGIDETLTPEMIAIVNEAKQNLLSIGGDLAGQITELLDVGPIGAQITALEDQLTARRRRRQRLSLVEDLEDARKELKLALLETGPLAQRLEELQEKLDFSRTRAQRRSLIIDLQQAKDAMATALEATEIVPGGTERQQRAVRQFLAPFQQDVLNTKAALKEANLQGEIDKINASLEKKRAALRDDPVTAARKRIKELKAELRDFDDQAIIDSLQNTLEAQKKTVEQGLADIITKFNEGKITLPRMNKEIAALLKKVGVADYGAAARAMGEAFRAEFMAKLRQLQRQARAISIAPTVAGAGFEGAIVRPNEEISKIRSSSQSTADNTAAILEQIKKLVQNSNPPPRVQGTTRFAPPGDLDATAQNTQGRGGN